FPLLHHHHCFFFYNSFHHLLLHSFPTRRSSDLSFGPSRIRIKAGATVTFTNVGDLPHSATSMERGKWDTGVLVKGGSKAITFAQPGNYFYICLPHPWQYGQVIVE